MSFEVGAAVARRSNRLRRITCGVEVYEGQGAVVHGPRVLGARHGYCTGRGHPIGLGPRIGCREVRA